MTLNRAIDRRHYFVVYRRYLRVNSLMQRKTVIKYLRLPGMCWRASWITDQTKATHFEKQDDAFQVADKYDANVTHMSEAVSPNDSSNRT